MPSIFLKVRCSTVRSVKPQARLQLYGEVDHHKRRAARHQPAGLPCQTALNAPFAQEEQLYREQQHQHHCRELHHGECNHNGDKSTKKKFEISPLGCDNFENRHT